MNEEIGYVECRPRKSLWYYGLFFGTLGVIVSLLMLLPKPEDCCKEPVEPAVVVLWVGFWGSVGLGTLISTTLYRRRAYIIADECGLYWRGLGQERFAPWDEVTDYYDASQTCSTSFGRIETLQGTLKIGNYTNQEALRRLVQERATQACSCRWKPRPPWIKSAALPQEFRYSVLTYYLVQLPMALLATSTFVIISWGMWKMVSEMSGISTKLLVASSVLASLFSLATGLAAYAHWMMLRDAHTRFGEKIVATTEGLVFDSKSQHIEAGWDEITDYRIERGTGMFSDACVVETLRGTWSFKRHLSGVHILKRLIQERAPDSAPEDWHVVEDSTTLTPKADGCATADSYHFHSTSNRSMLWLAWTFALGPWLFPLISPQDTEASASPVALLIWASLGTIIATLLTYAYRNHTVEVLNEGIRQRTLLGIRYIRWDEVESYWKNDFGFHLVQGKKSQIRFYECIVRLQQLKEEIARRSINSRNREWHVN